METCARFFAMIRIQIDADTKAFERFTRALDALPEDLQRAAADTVQSADYVRKEVALYPGPVAYPFEWESKEHRIAYFASNGFGNGIPYQRTGNLGAAWKLRSVNTANGATLIFENKLPYASQVYGFFGKAQGQYKGHRNTGWPTLANTDRVRSLLYEELFANIVGTLARAGRFRP